MKSMYLALAVSLLAGPAISQVFTLKSDEIGGQATSKQVLNGFGCAGDNLSPQLLWENAPEGTKSFAVSVYDEDAPTGSGWWHWMIFDIPADVQTLKSGAGDLSKKLAPAGAIQSMTDFGVPGYGGPCPPEGDRPHKYTITVYALGKEKLGLDAKANPALVGFYLENNVIQKASLVMYYKR